MSAKAFLKELKTFILTVFFTFLFSLGVIWFLESLDPPLFTVGLPGLAQLSKAAPTEWFNLPVGDAYLGIFIFVANIPILILGYFGVSKKFTFYSFISVIIQMTVVGFIPRDNFGLTAGLDTFSIAVIGGIITGIGIGGALKIGTSLGGMDIISQYFSLLKGVSFGLISLLINVSITILSGVIYKDPSIVAYTAITIIITTLVTDKVHTSYQFLKVEIITTHSQELIDEILVKLQRGATLMDVKGGYRQQEKQMIVIAISTYELDHLKEILFESDPSAFIMVQPLRHIYGHFKRKTIV